MWDIDKLKKIGSGQCADVFHLNETKVLRKSRTKIDGFIAILNLSSEQRDEYRLVKIFDMDNENKMWSVCEKLYQVNPDRFNIINGSWMKVNDFREIPIFVKETDHELSKIISLGIKLFKDLRTLGYPVNDLDLNRHNIMQRSNGQLVLTDPISTLDY
jgi:hypothetical protein